MVAETIGIIEVVKGVRLASPLPAALYKGRERREMTNGSVIQDPYPPDERPMKITKAVAHALLVKSLDLAEVHKKLMQRYQRLGTDIIMRWL